MKLELPKEYWKKTTASLLAWAAWVVVLSAQVPEEYKPLKINEIQAANVDGFVDPSFNFGSWVEFYNASDRALAIAGLYLSDDVADLKKHRLSSLIDSVPAHGYRVVWFDHYGGWNKGELAQVPFKLDYEGGNLYLSDGETIYIRQVYPQAIGRMSYARTSDGAPTWGLSSTPTPGASNQGMTFATKQLPAPVVERSSGFFEENLSFQVEIPQGATLRYTLDYSTPTLENGEVSTSGRFSITASRVYRFRLFQEGYLPSEVTTRSFVKGHEDIPVVMLVIDRQSLYNPTRGLFAKGSNGRPGHGQDEKCNWNMDWDRPACFDYLNAAGECVFSQEVDVAVTGAWSRHSSPHPLKLKAAKYYQGKNTLNYSFFEAKPYLKHKAIVLRHGGTGGLLRDASLQEVMRRSGLNIDTQSWKPVKVYLNGSFYGDYNLREPSNKQYGYANYGIDTDEMDQFEINPDSGYVQMAGTRESMDRLLELCDRASEPETYEEIGRLLDLDAFANYLSAEIYLGNWDWPQNNVKAFRDRNDGKFRFVVFDLDGVFGADLRSFKNKRFYTTAALKGEDGWGNSLWGQTQRVELEPVRMFDGLITNPDFARRFVDAFCLVGGSVFHPDFALPIIDAMAREMDVWTNDPSTDLKNRQPGMAQQLAAGIYDLGVTPDQAFTARLSVSDSAAALFLNDQPVPTGRFEGLLYHPVTLKAVAPAGTRFDGWLSQGFRTDTLFSMGATWQYYDGGSLDGTGWKKDSLNAVWKTGPAPLGYDDAPRLATSLAKNHLTYYFRRTVTLASAPSPEAVLTLNFKVDDGAVIYVNGKEAGRYNMPKGDVTFNTQASRYAPGNPDESSLTLPLSLFRQGDNQLAVEVHNNNPTSSDIYWDASLSLREWSDDDLRVVSQQAEYTIPEGEAVRLTALFEPLSDGDAAEGIPVRINEVSASNSVYADDYYQRDDWVELYNTTDQPYDIAGMYLSDDPAKPKKWAVPANEWQNTVIAPHGYRIIWANKLGNSGTELHASFKLGNNDGECVILTSRDGTWSDRLVYPAHRGDETVGRYPDGASRVYLLQRPTIAKANELTSYARLEYDEAPSPSDAVVAVRDSAEAVSVEYFNLLGQRLGGTDFAPSPGLYLLRYTLRDGSFRSEKIRLD